MKLKFILYMCVTTVLTIALIGNLHKMISNSNVELKNVLYGVILFICIAVYVRMLVNLIKESIRLRKEKSY